jgi:hypothetical protein
MPRAETSEVKSTACLASRKRCEVLVRADCDLREWMSITSIPPAAPTRPPEHTHT